MDDDELIEPPLHEAPSLDSLEADVMRKKGFTLRDGGVENLRFTDEAIKSRYCPYETLTVAIFAEIIRRLSLTRREAGILGRCLRYVDKDGESIKAADVPTDTDHFHAKMRKRAPLERVWEHPNKTSVTLAPSALIQRVLESRGAFEEVIANQQGKVLSEAEGVANHVTSRHLTAIATKPRGRGREGTLHGDIAAGSCLFGLDTVEVTAEDGHTEEVAVGDTVRARVAGAGAGGRSKVVPCRLAELRWRYKSDDDVTDETGRLVPVVNRFLTAEEANLETRWRETAGSPDDKKRRVWEVSNQRYSIEVNDIFGRIVVVPSDGEQGPGISGSGDRSTYLGKGFVSRWPDEKLRVVEKGDSGEALSWRHEGLERGFFRRWGPDVFSNTRGLDVVAVPVCIFSDAADYNGLGGARCPINASLFSLANTNVQRRRLSSSWHLFSLGGVGSAWQDELAAGLEIFGRMQNGCVARVRRGDKTVQVSGVVVYFPQG